MPALRALRRGQAGVVIAGANGEDANGAAILGEGAIATGPNPFADLGASDLQWRIHTPSTEEVSQWTWNELVENDLAGSDRMKAAREPGQQAAMIEEETNKRATQVVPEQGPAAHAMIDRRRHKLGAKRVQDFFDHARVFGVDRQEDRER